MSNRPKGHLGPRHPLAGVAARLCEAHLGPWRVSGLGGVACGGCWEQAIRNDESVVVEFGLARDVEPDPSFVDEVAVDLALQGACVALTPAERAEVDRLRELATRKQEEFENAGWMSWQEVRSTRRGRRDWKGRPKQAATVAASNEESAA